MAVLAKLSIVKRRATGSKRPTPAGGHSELLADKQPVATCDRLSESSHSMGSAQMALNLIVALHDVSVV